MVETTNHPSEPLDISARLKAFRKVKGYSIRSLAEKAGLSPNTISLIESNSTSPTIATLETIANALDIPLSAFLTHFDQTGKVIVWKARQFEHRSEGGISVSPLPVDVLKGQVQVMHYSIEPGANSGAEPIVHAGSELVICLQGELEYQVNGQVYTLFEQDAVGFDGYIPHSWRNRAHSQTRFLVMIANEQAPRIHPHLQPAE